MGKPQTKVAELYVELGITRQTLCRHVTPGAKSDPPAKSCLPAIPVRFAALHVGRLTGTVLVPPASPRRLIDPILARPSQRRPALVT